MTDRICALTVVLSDNIREDDAQRIKYAIAQLKGVVEVKQVIADSAMYCARAQARHEILETLLDVLREGEK